MKSPLKDYRERRNFTLTPEPRGSDDPAPREGDPVFVIQKHDADLPHFDFRLEADGVLRSWVLPDGMPEEDDQRRLALQMENYPREYLDFEGMIPAEQYGGGKIAIWDQGTYLNLTVDNDERVPPAKAIEQGRLDFEIFGTKVQGKFRLDRTENGPEPRWLLLKK